MRKAQILLFILLLGSEAKAQNYSVPSKYEFESSLKKPETIIRVSENHYFIDFGKAAFGTIEISTEQSQADTIVLHLGEKITGENKIDRNPGGTIRYQKVHLINMETEKPHHVELPAVKRNTCPPAIILPDSFGVIMPFRYCELENLKIPIDEIEIRQKVYNYKFDENASSFISSDTILNQIWDLCKHTIKATSFAGLYIDGDRERIPYEADAFINQLSHYCVDTEYSIARRTNEYFIEHPTWPTEWVLHTVLLFYYDYLYTGDLKSITNNYEVLKRKTLMDLEGKDGLISSKSDKLTEELMKYLGFSNPDKRIRDIVDWPGGERDGYDMKDVNTVVNSFYYINLKLMSEIAGYLGKEKDSVFFKEKSILVKDAINEKLFDQIKGVYIDGEGSKHSSLHANMFPLAFDLVPGEYVKSVVSFIKSRGMSCSVYGAQYLLEALYKQNESKYAFQLITESSSDRSWWNMIITGSTMTLEAWDAKYKPNLDWNHAWGTAPANIITRYIWGITPSQPGFSRVEIKPQIDELTFSKIKVPTVLGPINAEYKTINEKYKYFEIEIPQNMKGEFIVPVNKNYKFFVNKKKLKNNKGYIPLYPGLTVIEVKQ